MDDFPSPVQAYLNTRMVETSVPAYLLVDKTGHLTDWGGELAAYGVADLHTGQDIAQHFPLLEGLLPLDDLPLLLPCIEMDTGRSANLHLFSTEEGDWVVLLDVTSEVTQRRLLQQKLNDLSLCQDKQAKALDQYRALAEGSIQGVLIQQNFVIRFINETTAEIFGYASPDDLIGQDVRHLVAAPERARLEGYTAACLQGDLAPSPCEWQGLRKDGTLIWVDALMSTMPCESGAAILITLRDRSECKHLEAQLLQVEKMAAMGALAGGIAHDFNNILTAIVGYTELAQYDVPQESMGYRNLQKALTASKRACELVQQILAFCRQKEPKRQPVQLYVLVKEVLTLLRASLPSTIDIRQQVDQSAGSVLADPTQLHQVLMNLCTNAEYAMRQSGGVLEVNLEAIEADSDFAAMHAGLEPGPHIRLSVRDTGHGIAPELLERIFDPFFTTKRVGEGTGMGLTGVRNIITSHGGAIAVMSVLEHGTTFEIYLPRIGATTNSSTPSEEPISGGHERILFVDDEPALARLGQEMLERLGYDTVVHTNSLEALETFRAAPQRFDLVITDQTMPHLTGEALTRELWRIRPDIPIILCTGFSHTMTEDKAQALGIEAFLVKPLAMRELALAIRSVLTHGMTLKTRGC